MVSTRSGGGSAANQSTTEVEVTSSALQHGTSRRAARRTPFTPKSARRAPKEAVEPLATLDETESFLGSVGVHTRSEGPVPAISLSTELPDSVIGMAAAEHKKARSKSPSTSVTERKKSPRKLRSSLTEEFDKARGSPPGGDAASREKPELTDTLELESDVEEEQPGPGPAGELSDNDSDSDEDPFGGLAASMWAALQSQRLNQRSASERPASASGPGTGIGREAAQPTSGRESNAEIEEIEWRPNGRLPKPLCLGEAVLREHPNAAESGLNKQLLAPPRDAKQEKKDRKAAQQQQRNWHDLPTTPITDEVRRDLRLLRLRGAMDPKRFYKKAEKGRFPSQFAIGTVVEGPTEFYSGRLTKKQRKQTLTEELLADSGMRDSQKRRFEKLQEENSRWSHKKHKGAGERLKKRAKTPKH